MITYYAAMGKYRLEQFDGGGRPGVFFCRKEEGGPPPGENFWEAPLLENPKH